MKLLLSFRNLKDAVWQGDACRLDCDIDKPPPPPQPLQLQLQLLSRSLAQSLIGRLAVMGR
jgi:hypothetical protein